MCLEIWNMRIAVSNVVSEYSIGGVYFTHKPTGSSGALAYRIRDMRFET